MAGQTLMDGQDLNALKHQINHVVDLITFRQKVYDANSQEVKEVKNEMAVLMREMRIRGLLPDTF